jgi:large subunit GTPase 1
LETEFNEPTHKNALIRWAGKKRAPVTRVGKGADTFIPSNVVPTAPDGSILPAQALGSKSRIVDQEFFETNSALKAKPFVSGGKEFARAQAYPHQNAVANDGTPIPLKQARLIALLQQNSETGKKHKKMKRTKQRSGKGYD